jgi:hypothetical protein
MNKRKKQEAEPAPAALLGGGSRKQGEKTVYHSRSLLLASCFIHGSRRQSPYCICIVFTMKPDFILPFASRVLRPRPGGVLPSQGRFFENLIRVNNAGN